MEVLEDRVITLNSQAISTGNGSITISGEAGNGSGDDQGVTLDGESIVSTANSTISIYAVGDLTNPQSSDTGLLLRNRAKVQSSGGL